MEELVKSDMKTPIEIALGVDENGTTTARALYEFLELAQGQFSRWAKANIESNEFYEENKDWWGFDIVSNGNNCKDYRLTTDFAKHLSMESHSERGKEARRYFIAIEDRAKQEVINRSQLSPQTQLILQLAQSIANKEMEDKERDRKIAIAQEIAQKAVETTNNIKEAVKPVLDNWRAEIKSRIAKIAPKANMNYGILQAEMYKELERRAGVDLNRRVNNMKQRAKDSCSTKKQVDDIRKIDVIEQDKKLREIYSKIVTEYEIRYCA